MTDIIKAVYAARCTAAATVPIRPNTNGSVKASGLARA